MATDQASDTKYSSTKSIWTWVKSLLSINQVSNVGSGAGLYKDRIGDNVRIKSLLAGTNMAIVEYDDHITLNASGSGSGTPLNWFSYAAAPALSTHYASIAVGDLWVNTVTNDIYRKAVDNATEDQFTKVYSGSTGGGGGSTSLVTLDTSGTVDINASLSDKFTITPTAEVTLTTSNFTDMKTVTLHIVNNLGLVAFPAGWQWSKALTALPAGGVNCVKLSAYTFESTLKINAEELWNYNAQPFDMSNLGLWINPEDVSLANNAAVETLPDSSGNLISIGQSTADYRPVWKTNIHSALGAIQFSSGKYLQVSNYVSKSNSAFVIVLKDIVRVGGYYNPIWSCTGTGWSTLFTNDNSGYIGRYAYSGTQYEDSTGVLESPSNLTILMWNFDVDAGTWSLYRDGTLVSTQSYSTPYSDTTSYNFYINHDFTYAGEFTGYVFDVMQFKNKLSDDQRISVNNYLKTKYGL
jgi:hypothetical protein